jgi:hypothetical protein
MRRRRCRVVLVLLAVLPADGKENDFLDVFDRGALGAGL